MPVCWCSGGGGGSSVITLWPSQHWDQLAEAAGASVVLTHFCSVVMEEY